MSRRSDELLCTAAAGLTAMLQLGTPAHGTAGAWNQQAHHYYLQLGYGYQRATELATPAGEVVGIPAFTKHQAGLYAEYGLTSWLTGVLDSAGYSHSEIEEFDSAGGIADLRLGLQLSLPRLGPWSWSLRGIVQAPTGDETRGFNLLPTGSGAWEGEAHVAVGRSVAGGRGWLQASVGHQIRGAGLRDTFLYAAQAGGRVGPARLFLSARGVQPYDVEPGDLSTRSAAGFGDGVTYLTWGPGLIVGLSSRLSVHAGLDVPAHTRNIAHGITYRLALAISR